MDSTSDKDWKKRVGFPINYESSQSSDDDFDKNDVVMRHPRRSADYLLADGGDGAEADLLGTTPPRARIRNKEKRRTHMDELHLQRMFRENRNSMTLQEQLNTPDFAKKRLAIKVSRNKERDFKLDNSDIDHKADSLPLALPETLVESCSRFMSLSSRLKCRQYPNKPDEEVEERWKESELDEQLPPSRVNFHQTFSMLINMGNIEKGCRRTISREEQVWQNELKDLIWLELQAKIARRTLPQQDAFLCTQRQIVPNTVQNIVDYKFIRQDECREQTKRTNCEKKTDNSDFDVGCISFTCEPCMAAIGIAMKEVGSLLDAFYNAMSLYPSSKAMTVEHPLIATQPFQDRVKAMCLWYNTASHMRMKIISIRRMMMSLQKKHDSRSVQTLTSVESQTSGSTVIGHRHSQVRFEINSRPTDSSNSDSSAHSEAKSDLDTGQTEVVLPKELDMSETKADIAEVSVQTPYSERDETDSTNLKTNEPPSPATPEIVISSESPYSSASSGYMSGVGGVCDVADVTQLSQLRLLGNCHVSPYRDYHYEMLKTQGVRRCMMFVDKMRRYVLNKVYYTLEKSQDNRADPSVEEQNTDHNGKKTEVDEEEAMNINELRRYGCWSEENIAMRLPSYRSHFLLLSSICMEAVHDYLSMRLEDRPDHPSCLTIKQLIHELKEGLDIATDIRLCFTRNLLASAAGGRGQAGGDLCRLLRTFDHTVNSVYSEYVSYLTKISTTEHMPRSYIQSEWAFATQIARRNKSALLQAADTFCDIACNQINRLVKNFEDQFNQIKYSVPDTPEKHTLYALCREAQLIYSSEREPALQAALSARALAASLPQPAHAHRDRLLTSLMSMRDCLVKHTELILERSQAAVQSTPIDEDTRDNTEVGLTRVRELLLQIYRLAFELHKELYRFAQAPFKSVQPPRRPASLQPMRHVEEAWNIRKRPGTMMITESINPMVHKELHRFVYDPNRVQLRKQGSCCWGRRLNRGDSVIDEVLNDNKIFETDGSTTSSIELILAGETPKPDLPTKNPPPPIREEDKQWAAKVARAIISFAKCWMQFVVERCDRGRGLRPRWASQGLEFLMLACDPCNTKHLNDEEFEELKQLMDGCISHVVGSRPVTRGIEPATTTHKHRTRLQSPLSHSSSGSNKEIPTPPTPPPNEAEPLLNYHETDSFPTKSRVLEAIKQVDSERDRLLRERKAVGRVIERTKTDYEPKLRRLTFKWQRGLKIGAGTFGKVYTIVNTESGQLLAMKELNIGANDRRALQRAANELQVLEGVLHPHLVRYYGCELHREEMLIFMELCVEGSLEALVATSGALPEHLTRRYTKQLLSAVAELHARTIAHRDIKSGNIFLTNEGHCLKLGDFGCAVKIRAHSTAPGELQGFVGTQAYMAPEVFMKSSGHGRGADIWSLGCVVAEMASGKRPFSEYDSNYQIMFVVGMGGRPHIPDTLSEEGQQFCLSCLTHDSEERPSAQSLTTHHFLKLQADDDCKCEPAYLK